MTTEKNAIGFPTESGGFEEIASDAPKASPDGLTAQDVAYGNETVDDALTELNSNLAWVDITNDITWNSNITFRHKKAIYLPATHSVRLIFNATDVPNSTTIASSSEYPIDTNLTSNASGYYHFPGSFVLGINGVDYSIPLGYVINPSANQVCFFQYPASGNASINGWSEYPTTH